MKKIILLIISCSALAYMPSLESLLRNPNSGKAEDKTIVVNISIEDRSDSEKSFSFYKYFIRGTKFCEANFSNKLLKKASSLNCNHFYKVRGEFEKKLYYATLSSLFSQSGKDFVKLIQNYGGEAKLNSQLLNKNKHTLYKRYMEYSKKRLGKNPLSIKSATNKKLLTKTLKQQYIMKDQGLSRVKLGNDFFIKYEDRVSRFLFDNESHRLINAQFNTSQGVYSLRASNYLSFSGNFEVPEKIKFSLEGQRFYVRINKVELINENSSSFNSRISKVSKSNIKANKSKITL